ncbi:rhamnulokinase [Alicyclobacillus tolerans]|uniref:Rhamnulokinase n=1 Tax=Alicyclobacillus tolerans TaxID=90970 RepID=A0A1M6NLT5_9BACL|nr:rhamnulokinase family protein [Alicyclobacillus montanus]SHJ96522.1 rhamnulokinase [Alicyclobacillus montanus]
MFHSAAIDIGASSGRVIRGSFDGNQLQVCELYRFSNQPVTVHGRMYWDIYRLYAEIKDGLRRLAAESKSVKSVGIDTWAVDYGLLDKDGLLMNLPRHYRDSRTLGMMERVEERIHRNQLFARTGIQRMPINTLYQLMAEQVESPERLSRATHLLLIPDLLNYFLTGQKWTEFTNATTTQLLCAGTKHWDMDLLQQLDLPSHYLGKIVSPGTPLGHLSDLDLLQDSRVAAASVIHVASHDTASAVLGIPVQSESFAYISSGTWSLFGTLVSEPIINERTAEMNFTNEGGYQNYRLLKNIMGLWLLQQTELSEQKRGNICSIPDMLRLAQNGEPFAFYFDTEDTRLLPPGDIPSRIYEICRENSQNPPVDLGTLVRGILENLAFQYRYVLDQLEEILQRRIQVIHIVGGGAQNELLCQFTADATGRPVIAGPIEASAIGNLGMQLLAQDELRSSSELQELVKRSVITKLYEPLLEKRWEEAYKLYLESTGKRLSNRARQNICS